MSGIAVAFLKAFGTETIQNGIAEVFVETIRRDHCEQGIPVIGCKKASREVGAIDLADLLDIAVQKPQEPIGLDIRIPENAHQFGIYVYFPKI